MSKSCKPLHPGLFLLGAATAALVFAAPQTCAEAFRQGLALCGGPLLVSLFPFLVVSALIMRSGAGEVLGVLLWPVVRCIGLRSRSAGSVLLIGLVGGFAPAAAATAEAVRSRELTSQEASALLPACICSGPSFVILTVGEQLLGSRTAGVCLFAAQVLAGWLTAALLCRVRGIPEPLPAPPAAAQTEPPPALDTILAQAAVTYLKLCGFVLYFRLLAAGCGLLLPAVFAPFPAMLLEVCSGCDYAARTGLWASGLCRAQRAGRFGAAAGAHPLPAGGLASLLAVGQTVASAAFAGAVLSGLTAERCGKLQYFVRPCGAHAAGADRLRPAGVRGVLHHSVRGLPPDREEGAKCSSGKQKLLCGLQTAAKCGNITLGYHITKRSDGESRRCLHGKERSFTG